MFLHSLCLQLLLFRPTSLSASRGKPWTHELQQCHLLPLSHHCFRQYMRVSGTEDWINGTVLGTWYSLINVLSCIYLKNYPFLFPHPFLICLLSKTHHPNAFKAPFCCTLVKYELFYVQVAQWWRVRYNWAQPSTQHLFISFNLILLIFSKHYVL